MIATKKSIAALLFFVGVFTIKGQLPINVNKTYGVNTQGTMQGALSEDWHYAIKTLTGGGHIAGGYSKQTSSPFTRNPTIVKYNSVGALIWEQKYPCIDGVGYDIFELLGGYLLVGYGTRTGGCVDPPSLFTLLVDRTTGLLDPSYGVKMYNCQTLPLPSGKNGLSQTNVDPIGAGNTHACEIKNSAGQTIGFMLSGNYIDNEFPSTTTSASGSSNGCFLLKLDINGIPDPSFGTNGLAIYMQNSPGRYLQPLMHDVCVNYSNAGNPQGFVAVGSVNENPSVFNTWGNWGNDAFYMMIDLIGNVTFLDVFDEGTRLKNTLTPVGFPYTDAADNLVPCPFVAVPFPTLNQENQNQRATCVKQLNNGGEFIIVAQFDWRYGGVWSCPETYPNFGLFGYITADPAVIKMDPSGNLIWATNIFESTGRDFENDLLIANGFDIFVLGSTATDPAPSPIEQKAYVSKLDANGNIIYEQAYNETGNGQLRYCPFAFDLDGNGIIIAGDNELNGDNYQLIKYLPY